MDHIVLNEPDYANAIAKRAGTTFNHASGICLARVRDGDLLGGVIYSHYTGESIAIHSASWNDHWINRDMLFVTFDYPFNQLGVKRIFGQVPEDNIHARNFNTKLGFRVVARIEGVFRHNIACLVMCLERKDCRFLGMRPRDPGFLPS